MGDLASMLANSSRDRAPGESVGMVSHEEVLEFIELTNNWQFPAQYLHTVEIREDQKVSEFINQVREVVEDYIEADFTYKEYMLKKYLEKVPPSKQIKLSEIHISPSGAKILAERDEDHNIPDDLLFDIPRDQLIAFKKDDCTHDVIGRHIKNDVPMSYTQIVDLAKVATEYQRKLAEHWLKFKDIGNWDPGDSLTVNSLWMKIYNKDAAERAIAEASQKSDDQV